MLFRRMRKKPKPRGTVAKEMSRAEMDKYMSKIGKHIHSKRQAKSSQDTFAYEINMSRSALAGYEKGGDMYLSTFIKLLYGLDITPEDFFKELK